MNTTLNQTQTVAPFRHPLDVNENAWLTARQYYAAILSDGREVNFFADKVVITDTGDMLAISTHKYDEFASKIEAGLASFTGDTPGDPWIPRSEPKTMLSIAKGSWTAFYAQSVSMSAPISVESVIGPMRD
jgi:hypothetical protein